MKNSSYKIVLKKEFKDAFRDKKSVVLNFLLPLIIMPIIFIILSFALNDIIDKATNCRVAVIYDNKAIDDDKTDIYNFLQDKVFKEREGSRVTIMLVDDAKDALLSGKVDAVVAIPEKFNEKNIKENNASKIPIDIIYDEFSTNSQTAAVAVKTALSAYTDEIYSARLEDNLKDGITESDLIATELNQTDASTFFKITRKGSTSYFMQMILPFMVTIMLSAGGISMAVDLFAGEKERNTFEPLLSTGADRLGIVMAKFTVILVFSLLNSVLQLAVFIIGFSVMPSAVMGGGSVSIPMLMLAFINVILLAGLFNSILLLMSATSKNSKEASTKLGAMIMIPMMLAFVTMFADANTIKLWTAFIPVLNTVNSLKMVIVGNLSAGYLIASILTNAILLAGAIWYTLKAFSKEKLLARF